MMILMIFYGMIFYLSTPMTPMKEYMIQVEVLIKAFLLLMQVLVLLIIRAMVLYQVGEMGVQ